MRIDEIYAQKCAEPSDINEHLPVLKDYAAKCETVTEFGVRGVVSTWALIAGRPGLVTSYDLVSPGAEALYMIHDVTREAKVGFVFHEANTRTANINPTDMLFVDTYHTFEQLRHELDRHGHLVRKWIILHDTEIFGEKGEDGGPGLNSAIRDFLLLNFTAWRQKDVLTNNNGLTILERV